MMRIALILLLSFGCTVPCIFFIYILLKEYLNRRNSLVWDFFDAIFLRFGVMNSYVVTAVVMFTFFVLLFSLSSIRYFVQIMWTVEDIQNNNFARRIPVRGDGELSDLAAGINKIVERLKSSLEDERKAEQTKNELITNVSHDLRTPLTSIIGYLRLIGEDRYKDEVELRHYTDIAYEKSRRLERMVEDLFEYTKMRFGQNVLNRAEINLTELIGQLAADFTPQLRDAGMEIRLSFQEERVLILADGDKLMRAFENLLSNAIKYGRSGKYIDLAVRRNRSAVQVQVANYGPPIPSADLPHIFERFYRAEKSRSEASGGGSGLGLAIVKSIVDAHNGAITVSSGRHQTVFEVGLPLGAAEEGVVKMRPPGYNRQ